MLWRCWLGGRKGIRPVKNFESWGAGMVICLERGADLHMAQLIPLPLTISCSSKIQIGFTFLVPAHLGSPGQRAVKRVRAFSVAHCLAPAPLKLRPYGAIHTHVYYYYYNNYSEAEMESDGGISSRLVEWIRSWRGHIIALQQVWQWNMTDAQRLTTILVLHLQKYVSIVLIFFYFYPR